MNMHQWSSSSSSYHDFLLWQTLQKDRVPVALERCCGHSRLMFAPLRRQRLRLISLFVDFIVLEQSITCTMTYQFSLVKMLFRWRASATLVSGGVMCSTISANLSRAIEEICCLLTIGWPINHVQLC